MSLIHPYQHSTDGLFSDKCMRLPDPVADDPGLRSILFTYFRRRHTYGTDVSLGFIVYSLLMRPAHQHEDVSGPIEPGLI